MTTKKPNSNRGPRPLSVGSSLGHLRLIGHKHTGKLIHHRHTSHLSLLIVLLILGIFLFVGGGFSNAKALSDNQNIVVTANVPVNSNNIVAETVAPNGHENILNSDWFETSVPLYTLALALTLGFWVGDIFDRKFKITKPKRKN